MSPTDPLTALVVNLTGVDPDDAFSRVPYEKGSAFLWYLEDTGGVQNLCLSLCILYQNSRMQFNLNKVMIGYFDFLRPSTGRPFLLLT